MRLSDYWSVVHAWNDHRRNRSCLVCVVPIQPGEPSDMVELGDFLALDFAHAAATGALEPHAQAVANRKRVAP